MQKDHILYHFISSGKHFILKDAFTSVLTIGIADSRRRKRYLELLLKVPVHSLKEGDYISNKDIPDAILNSLKLSYENLLRALRVHELEAQNNKVVMRDMIYSILHNSIEDNWIQHLHKYSEYSYERAISYSRLHVLLNEYLNLPYSIKDIYLASKNIFSEDENWNYNYLTEKLKRVRNGNSSIEEELKPQKGKVNNLKFTPELKDKAETEFETEFSNYDDILEEVNRSARKLGLNEITKSTLKAHLRKKDIQNRLRLKRNGEEWYKNNIEAPIHLKKPELRDELYEADGSRIQIPYYDPENNDVDFLSVFVILDVATGNVVGYSCDQYENHEMALVAFDRAINIHGVMPRSITTDKARHYNAKRFKDFKSFSKKMGVVWRETSNPSGKPYVESFFRLFGQKISKSSPGYYGLGITCMNPDSRSERRRISKILKNKQKLFSKEELIVHVDSLIEYYKVTKRGDEVASPSNLYDQQKKSHGVVLSDLDRIKLIWKWKDLNVTKSEIRIKRGNKFYYFQLNYQNGLNYSGTKIRVHYNESLSHVYCFNSEGTFIEKVKAFNRINPSPATSTEEDKNRMNELLSKRTNRKKKLEKESSDRKNRVKENESKIIPIELYGTITHDKSKEYEAHKEFTRRMLDPEKSKVISIRSNDSTLDFNIDRSRLYKKIDD